MSAVGNHVPTGIGINPEKKTFKQEDQNSGIFQSSQHEPNSVSNRNENSTEPGKKQEYKGKYEEGKMTDNTGQTTLTWFTNTEKDRSKLIETLSLFAGQKE